LHNHHELCNFTLGVFMGFLDKAKAMANEIIETGSRTADSVVSHLDEASANNNLVGKTLTSSREKLKLGLEVAREKTEELSEHAVGEGAGRLVRKVGEAVSKAPVISAAMDVAQAKNCVDIFLNSYRTHSSDPYSYIWLAESLIRTSADMEKYRYVKNALDPSALVVGSILQKTAEFGKDSLPLEERALRRAWQLAVMELRSNARNSPALDVLARIYLAKGNKENAVALAKSAVLADRRNPIARVTLARAFLNNGSHEEAYLAGLAAAKTGSSVGLLYAGEAQQHMSMENDEVKLAGRISDFDSMVSGVTDDDLRQYRGAYRNKSEIMQIVKSRQAKKIGNSVSTGKRWARIIKNA
jgi:tetratricopeptide (TPR) repeat protein